MLSRFLHVAKESYIFIDINVLLDIVFRCQFETWCMLLFVFIKFNYSQWTPGLIWNVYEFRDLHLFLMGNHITLIRSLCTFRLKNGFIWLSSNLFIKVTVHFNRLSFSSGHYDIICKTKTIHLVLSPSSGRKIIADVSGILFHKYRPRHFLSLWYFIHSHLKADYIRSSPYSISLRFLCVRNGCLE